MKTLIEIREEAALLCRVEQMRWVNDEGVQAIIKAIQAYPVYTQLYIMKGSDTFITIDQADELNVRFDETKVCMLGLDDIIELLERHPVLAGCRVSMVKGSGEIYVDYSKQEDDDE